MWLLPVSTAHAWFDVLYAGDAATWGEKRSGASVLDYNRDGLLDLVAADGYGGARLFRNQGRYDLSFSDVTHLAPGLEADTGQVRGLLVADLNNDGGDDLVKVSIDQVDVFLNDRPSGGNGFTLAYTFGATGGYYGKGFEGAAILDVDHDGWLDVFVSEGFTANWLLANPADGTLDFGLTDLSAAVVPSSENSDFAAVADWNGDGHVDLLLRGAGAGVDAWLGDGSSFVSTSFDLDFSNDVKGGLSLYDGDRDGDLDLYLTSGWAADLTVWDWDGASWEYREADHTYRVYGGYQSVGHGDFEHDGWPEVFTSGADYSLTLTDGSVFDDDWYECSLYESGLSPTVADLDADGDLDVFETAYTGASRLFRNHLSSSAWLQFTLSANVGTCRSPVFRNDIGGSARLYDAGGAPVSGLLEVSGGTGRGQTGSPWLHVGGVDPWSSTLLEVHPMVPGLDDFVIEVPAGPGRLVDIRLDDPDGDGVVSAFEQEGPTDPDGDGLANVVDPDSDDDGLLDGVEAGPDCDAPLDTDGDGAYDFVDRDADDDGLDDAIDPGPTVADLDGDGLLDGEELEFGTDLFTADTDGGGRTDGDEVHRDGTNPRYPEDDLFDSDGDGIVDRVEQDLGLDPADPDSDDDGLSDGDELYEVGTEPLNPDTDGDGLTDGDEVAAGTDPLAPEVEEPPPVEDTDGDGLTDDEEQALGTDPTRKDTDGDGALDGADPAPLDASNGASPLTPSAADPGFGLGCSTTPGAGWPGVLTGLLVLARGRRGSRGSARV
jgi:hypothetical protein